MVYAQPPAQMPGWHPAARIQMGYTMQFHTPSVCAILCLSYFIFPFILLKHSIITL